MQPSSFGSARSMRFRIIMRGFARRDLIHIRIAGDLRDARVHNLADRIHLLRYIPPSAGGFLSYVRDTIEYS